MKKRKVFAVVVAIACVIISAIVLEYFHHRDNHVQENSFEYVRSLAEEYHLEKIEENSLIVLRKEDEDVIPEIVKWVRDTDTCSWASVDIAIFEEDYEYMLKVVNNWLKKYNCNSKKKVEMYIGQTGEDYRIFRLNSNTMRVTNVDVDYFLNYGMTIEDIQRCNPDLDISKGVISGEVYLW